MTSTVTGERQERILSAVRKGQEIALDTIKTATHAASRVTSKIPEVKLPFKAKLPFAGTFPKLEAMLPKLEGELARFEGKFPKPESVVSGTYDFAEKLLAQQRRFAEDVLKATAALRPAAKEAAEDAAAEDAASEDGVVKEAAGEAKEAAGE